MARRHPLFASALVVLAVSCGASESHDDATDSRTVECPDIAPRGMPVEACTDGLPAEGCTYTLDCASGPRDFTFMCVSQFWYVEPSPCELPGEFCTGGEQQVHCEVTGDGGFIWGASFGGYDGPAPCPTETPRHGDACGDGPFEMLGCGYYCDDGTTWTAGYCDDTSRTWVFDDACAP